MPVVELYDDDLLVFSGNAIQTMEYIELLPLRKNHALYIKKTSGSDYLGQFTLKAIQIEIEDYPEITGG